MTGLLLHDDLVQGPLRLLPRSALCPRFEGQALLDPRLPPQQAVQQRRSVGRFDLREEAEPPDLHPQHRHVRPGGELGGPEEGPVAAHREDEVDSLAEGCDRDLLVRAEVFSLQPSGSDAPLAQPPDQIVGRVECPRAADVNDQAHPPELHSLSHGPKRAP